MVLLGSLYLENGMTELAENELEIAYVAARDKLGETDVITIRAATELGSVYAAQARFGKAEQLQRRTLELAMSKFGRGHEKLWEQWEILAARIEQLGPDNPDTLLAKANLAATYCRQERWKDAETLAREATDARIEVLGPQHRETLRGRLLLANCYIGQQRFAEAVKEATEAVEGRKRIFGDDHKDTQFAMKVLSRALDSERDLRS
ncbi:hypothetical protein ACCO45_007891 [Purpureocillium lilacinum]|uniref:Uncharacterized protein n=1 Tax=Purpureocillium lilacinum TaxID=33203 RepID=A0ACC4DMH8_PURLI